MLLPLVLINPGTRNHFLKGEIPIARVSRVRNRRLGQTSALIQDGDKEACPFRSHDLQDSAGRLSARAQCAGAARRCVGSDAASAARGPVRAEAQPPPLPSRGSRQVKREPCRSGSGAATCAPTAAGLVSDAGPARRALPAGTPGGAVPAGGSLTAAQSLGPPGLRGARLSLACQPRGPGLPPSRGPAERRGGGQGTGRDRTGRARQPRKASDRSQTRAARGCRCFPFPVSRPARVRDNPLRRPTGHGWRTALLRAAAPGGQTAPGRELRFEAPSSH